MTTEPLKKHLIAKQAVLALNEPKHKRASKSNQLLFAYYYYISKSSLNSISLNTGYLKVG
jgi:hypothetical protein